MSVIQQIAFYQNRQDEIPNQELARRLAQEQDQEGIREIAENLWNKNSAIQSDCLKVLYETGYLQPELISPYANDFLRLLHSRNNRLVWGAMIALGTIAGHAANDLFPHAAEIQKIMENGSVITVDNGVLVLAKIAASARDRSAEIFPYLLRHLQICRAKEVPQHAEKILAAVNAENKDAFIAVLNNRSDDLSAAQLARVKKIIKQAEKL